jgi:uncharacterized protein (UPF0335 family)
MSADAQFRAFIDRILRCREAEDEAKEDTKAVYAEMKAEGYDKTVAGALVNELRKQEKNGDKFTEQTAMLDLYREAYERASGTGIAIAHTHTGATPIPSQDGKTESEGLASAPVTEQPETAKQSSVIRGPSVVSTSDSVLNSLAAHGLGEAAAPHSEQARFPSQGALAADPAVLLQAGSADQFNDTGPHVFSDSEVPA